MLKSSVSGALSSALSSCLVLSALALIASPAASAQNENQGQGRAIVTVMPKKDSAAPATVSTQDATLKINGKQAIVTSFKPSNASRDALEFVVMIDNSARTSLGTQLEDIAHFIKALPPNAAVAVAYMQNGVASFSAPFTTDRDAALKGLHLPSGFAGMNGSPYICLSDLAQRWPSNNPAARREVLMITDGVDPYNLRFDPESLYLTRAISDSAKAGLVVYSIYWVDRGRVSGSGYENNAGQNLLEIVAQATGGKSFWYGSGNPVSFDPYLGELNRRLRNQYELSFTSPLKGKSEVQTMKLKFSAPGSEVDAPQQVFVTQPHGENN